MGDVSEAFEDRDKYPNLRSRFFKIQEKEVKTSLFGLFNNKPGAALSKYEVDIHQAPIFRELAEALEEEFPDSEVEIERGVIDFDRDRKLHPDVIDEVKFHHPTGTVRLFTSDIIKSVTGSAYVIKVAVYPNDLISRDEYHALIDRVETTIHDWNDNKDYLVKKNPGC